MRWDVSEHAMRWWYEILECIQRDDDDDEMLVCIQWDDDDEMMTWHDFQCIKYKLSVFYLIEMKNISTLSNIAYILYFVEHTPYNNAYIATVLSSIMYYSLLPTHQYTTPHRIYSSPTGIPWSGQWNILSLPSSYIRSTEDRKEWIWMVEGMEGWMDGGWWTTNLIWWQWWMIEMIDMMMLMIIVALRDR